MAFFNHKIFKPNLNEIAIGTFADKIFLPKMEKEEANFGNNLPLNMFVHKVIMEKGGHSKFRAIYHMPYHVKKYTNAVRPIFRWIWT